ncbi:MAG: hypothetical protein CMF04_07970 [Hyphomonas sp.]|nr:hypothetical protein [Hyphomonas sp.]|tara:strand:- start:2446 stop:2649 length:204 start_codon:yes stop_codon:yes gene_type:complete
MASLLRDVMEDKITIRISPELADAFEEFIKSCPESIKTRQDGMRLILRDWLVGQGYLELPPDREDMH